ncbi:hypothetical protein N7528_002105 [Penicillium herquei]|nr:hypothetical protein N7528_002105 [Penicillium herquei]
MDDQALYLMNTGRESQALLHIGIATNIAQSIGLHRSLSAHNHPHEFQFVLKEHSLRICIWWACYCLDKKLSFELGRPSTIYDGDCDADLPDMSQAFTPSTQSIIGTQIPNFFTYFIDLCQRLSNISSRLFSIHTSTLDGKTGISLISNADTLLQDWRASLPEDLIPGHDSFEPKSEIFSIAASILNCTYLNALVLVHRSSLIGGSRSHYMRSHPDRRIAGSEKICVEAAHTLAHETNNLITEPRTIPVPRWINPYAINSIIAIFIALMRSPRRWSREVDLALLRSMHHCFQNREDPALMGRFESLLDMLIKAVERHSSVDLPTPQMEVDRQNIYQADTTSWSETPRGGEMHQRGISDFGDTSTTHHETDFQFDDLFGNQWNSWNFQLWPLVPVEEEDGMYMNAPGGAFSV